MTNVFGLDADVFTKVVAVSASSALYSAELYEKTSAQFRTEIAATVAYLMAANGKRVSVLVGNVKWIEKFRVLFGPGDHTKFRSKFEMNGGIITVGVRQSVNYESPDAVVLVYGSDIEGADYVSAMSVMSEGRRVVITK